jgi:tyrosyl-tRNA synthetase
MEDIFENFAECETEKELIDLIKLSKENEKPFKVYNGFEPSGHIHIGQALLTVMNAKLLIEKGGEMIIYLADWFAQLNHKVDGDLKKIRKLGEYFIEVFNVLIPEQLKEQNKIKFVWASEFIDRHHIQYWQRVMDISMNTTLNRIKKCTQIMGRRETDTLTTSQIFYPCMQCADIFELGIDVCQMGIDQRKVNMLARDYAKKKGITRPITLSHSLLPSLKNPKNKMSKSEPNSAIFMEDTNEQIRNKIQKAFCTDDIENNPIFEYITKLIFRWFNEMGEEPTMGIKLCGKEYNMIEEIKDDFVMMNKNDLKNDVAGLIDKIIKPVRQHFEINEVARNLLKEIETYNI